MKELMCALIATLMAAVSAFCYVAGTEAWHTSAGSAFALASIVWFARSMVHLFTESKK